MKKVAYNGEEPSMSALRRVIMYGILAGLGTALVASLPDIRRYIKISLM